MLVNNLYNLPSHFLGLLLLKKKPYDLPYSKLLLSFFIITFSIVNSYFILNYIPLEEIFKESKLDTNHLFSTLIGVSFFSKLIEATSVYFVLKWKGFAGRFNQTYTNLIGLSITVLLLSAIIFTFHLGEDLTAQITRGLFVWYTIVNVHVFKNSFDVKPIKAFGLYLLTSFVSIFLLYAALLALVLAFM